MNPIDSDTTIMQERLEQAAIITGRFAHDFGNYLTGILGFTELSLAQASADSPQRRFLQEVLQSAQNGATWIHRLQLFCRRSAGPTWPTHLAGVLAQEETRATAGPAPNLHWHADIPRDLPLLAMEASALQLALQEIITNTREATKNHGTLTLTAQDRSDRGRLQRHSRRRGTGNLCGTGDRRRWPRHPRRRSPETVPRGFLQHQAAPARRRLAGRLRHLAAVRGGLRLDTAGPGVCVRLYLPTVALDGPALASAAKPAQVLLAHANPQVFDSVVDVILEGHGCVVTEVASLQAAVAACAAPRTAVTLVLVDLTVSQMAGLELARRILDQDARMKFIFLHTQTSFHGLAEEELLNRFPLLRWPLQPAVLLNAVQTALTQRVPDKA